MHALLMLDTSLINIFDVEEPKKKMIPFDAMNSNILCRNSSLTIQFGNSDFWKIYVLLIRTLASFSLKKQQYCIRFH